jgi:hypothetical protein
VGASLESGEFAVTTQRGPVPKIKTKRKEGGQTHCRKKTQSLPGEGEAAVAILGHNGALW